MKTIILLLIRFYKIFISPYLELLFGKGCKYYPDTCSNYSHRSIQKYGLIKGGKMSIMRISSCHPWSKGIRITS